MTLQEKIKNGTTELQDFYRIAQRDIAKHKANITELNGVAAWRMCRLL